MCKACTKRVLESNNLFQRCLRGNNDCSESLLHQVNSLQYRERTTPGIRDRLFPYSEQKALEKASVGKSRSLWRRQGQAFSDTFYIRLYQKFQFLVYAHIRRKENDIKTLKSDLLYIPLLICTIKWSVAVYHKQRVNC